VCVCVCVCACVCVCVCVCACMNVCKRRGVTYTLTQTHTHTHICSVRARLIPCSNFSIVYSTNMCYSRCVCSVNVCYSRCVCSVSPGVCAVYICSVHARLIPCSNFSIVRPVVFYLADSAARWILRIFPKTFVRGAALESADENFSKVRSVGILHGKFSSALIFENFLQNPSSEA